MVWEVDLYPEEDRVNIPTLPAEIALQNEWKQLKPLFKDLQADQSHLEKIIVAFQRIKEYSRTIPREVFDEFSNCYGVSRMLKQDIKLMFKMAELYQKMNKHVEAEKLYQDSLDLVLSEGQETIFNLKAYVRLMAQRKRPEKCYETIEKLTAKYKGYTFYLALAAIEMKKFEKALVILGKFPQDSNLIIFTKLQVLYELKRFNEALELSEEVTQRLRATIARKKDTDYKLQIALAKGLFWFGKIRYSLADDLNAWPCFTNMTWEVMNIFREKAQIDYPYPYEEILVNLVPQAMQMMEEILREDYHAIKAKHSFGHVINPMTNTEGELVELAFNFTNFALEAAQNHENVKALILNNFSKIMMMGSRVEPSKKCFNVWQYDCSIDVKIRLGMIDEAVTEAKESRRTEDKKLKPFKDNVKRFKTNIDLKLFLLYTRLRYSEEADEYLKRLTRKSKDPDNDVLGFRHASTLYSEQRHRESIDLFNKHRKFLKTDFKRAQTFLWRPAMSYLHLGDYEKSDDALVDFMKSKRSGNNCSFEEMLMACKVRGTLYRKRKEFDEALNFFNDALQIGGGIYAPFHKMLTHYDSNKYCTKFMRNVIRECGSLMELVSFLQLLISHEERYLADEWGKILQIFILRSRDLWRKPEKVFPRLRCYRNSSLLSLHFVQKRVQCLNDKNCK